MIRLRAIEKSLHFLVFLLIIGAFIPLWRKMMGFGEDLVEGDALQRNLILIGYLLTMWVLILNPHRSLKLALRSPALWLWVGWSLISIAWSANAQLTLRRSLSLLLTALYGLTLALRFKPDQWLKLIAIALWVALFVSLFVALFFPEWGQTIYQNSNAWRGIFGHKNILGIVCLFAALVHWYFLNQSDHMIKRLFWGSGLILSVLELVLSQSAAPLVIGFVLIVEWAALILLTRTRQKMFAAYLIMGILIVLVIITLTNLEQILLALERDITFTGRIPLWKSVIEVGMKRAWVGFGYGAFWSGWYGPSGLVWQYVGWQAVHAHNAYLETWLNGGLVGFIFMTIFFTHLLTFFLSNLSRLSSLGYFWLLFTSLVLLYGLVESSAFRYNSIWLIGSIYISFTRSNLLEVKHL